MNRFIRAVLEGEDAAPGRIAATDVARLQLALPSLHFHEHRTVAELALEQGVHAPQDLDDLRASGIDADELAAFVAAAEQL